MRAVIAIAALSLMGCNRSEPVAGREQPLTPAVAVPAAPTPALTTVTAPAGRLLRVRTASAISTKTARNGATFTAVLAEPLVADGVTLAAKGATVTGVVANSDPGGRVKGVATLAVRLTHLELANGQIVSLSTNSFVRSAPHTKKKDALKVGIGSGAGAAIGVIAGGGRGAAIGAGTGAGVGAGVVLATRGAPAVILSESLLTFTLRRPVALTQ